MIKLLKAFYAVTDDVSRQTDIATRLVLRMMDEDDTIKDLAVKAVEELWFPTSSTLPSALKGSKTTTTTGDLSHDSLQNKVAVIMGVSANFRDRQSPLEDLLHKIMASKEEGSGKAQALHLRYEEICEVLIDGLVDASELPGFVSTTAPILGCDSDRLWSTVYGLPTLLHLRTPQLSGHRVP